MTDRAKFTLEEALAMSNHEFAEAFIDCDIDDVGGRWVQWCAVLEAKLDDVARKARLEGLKWSLPPDVNPYKIDYHQRRVILEIERLSKLGVK